MTVKGVPKDAALTETWHATTCSGSHGSLCDCKKQEKLTKDDFQAKLLNLTPEEEMQWWSFQHEATWGLSKFFTRLDTLLGPVIQERIAAEPPSRPESSQTTVDEPLDVALADNTATGNEDAEDVLQSLDDSFLNMTLQDISEDYEHESEDAYDGDDTSDDSSMIGFPECADITSADGLQSDRDDDAGGWEDDLEQYWSILLPTAWSMQIILIFVINKIKQICLKSYVLTP